MNKNVIFTPCNEPNSPRGAAEGVRKRYSVFLARHWTIQRESDMADDIRLVKNLKGIIKRDYWTQRAGPVVRSSMFSLVYVNYEI